MASVFLSYDREDAAKARSIALAIEKAGHAVWWDLQVRVGAQFSKVIEEALKAADAVVVLWSVQSVESPWVRDEAAAGRDSGRLVPVCLDETPAPLGFRQYQAIDFSHWKGRGKAQQMPVLLTAIDGFSDGRVEQQENVTLPTRHSWLPAGRTIWFSVTVLIGILALGALLFWRPWSTASRTPVIAVAAASPTPSARGLARDLLTKLGRLQATRTDSLTLVAGGDKGTKSDFTLEVEGATDRRHSTASLVLLGGKERSLLWSKDFEQPLAKQGDLNQQLAFTAAKVLECAVEALSSEGARMRQETLKLYLNGCSAYSELASFDPRPLVPVFLAVVEQAPRFEGAWAKLIHAETELAFGLDWQENAAPMQSQLRLHMAEARKLNPEMAEILLAEAEFAPPDAYDRRMSLLERAVERNPQSPEALAAQSHYLMVVGRAYDSMDRAKRATQLDPLSPFARDSLITTLTYAGETDLALEELRKAEQLWPGASNLLGSRYRIHLRYGDPQEALRIQRMGDYGGPHRDAFLEARIDPSPANIEKAAERPRTWLRRTPMAIGELAQVLGAFGKEEELFQILLNWQHPNDVHFVTEVLFRPALRNFRRDPRMIAVSKRIGLLGYWQQSGMWPDFCREPNLPYDCKAEAAKLR